MIRNLLDVPYSDTGVIRIRPDRFPAGNGPPEIGRLLSINIGGIEHINHPEVITADGFNGEPKITVPPNGMTDFVVEYSVWMAVGEEQTVRPQRVVEHFTMDIVSRCNHTPRIQTEGEQRIVSLLYNQPLPLGPYQGVSPGEKICVYTFLAPV